MREENGEQQQKKELETGDRERSERKWGEERKDEEEMTVTMANLTLRTGTTRGEQQLGNFYCA